jgi:molecular chaperone DnaK (HSP70)
VTFLIDANGILNVKASDMRTGQSQSVEVKPSYGLSDSEVERMIEDSFKFAQEDVTARKLIEARLEAGALLATMEKSLAEGGRLIAPDALASIRAAVVALNSAKEGNDPKAIRARMAELEQAAQPLSVAMLDDSLKRNLQGKKVTEVT